MYNRNLVFAAACLGMLLFGIVIHPSHYAPGDTTAKHRLDEALAEYKKRIAGV